MFAGLVLILTALAQAAQADAYLLTGNLHNNHVLNTTNLPIDAYVDLDFGAARAPFRVDGSFSLGDVAPGQHVVRPMVRGFAMTDLIVTIPDPSSSSGSEGVEGSDAEKTLPHVQAYIPGKQALAATGASLGFPLKVAAASAQTFYTPPNSMNILQMLKSPMVLMVLFSGVMAVMMPKLTAGMDDPELAKEMAAQRKRMTAASQMDWSGALASRLAGETPSEGPTVEQRTASPSAAVPASGVGTSSPGPGGRAPARGGASKRGGGKRR